MNKNYNTNEIVEAGLITGIIVVLMLITGYVPVLNLVSTLLLPVPVTVLALRRGYKLSVLSVVIGTILASMVYDPLTAVQSAISFGFLGISLAYCIKTEKSFGKSVLIMTLATFSAIILIISLYIGFITKNGIGYIYNLMDKSVAMFKDSYEGMKNIIGTNNLNSSAMKQYDKCLSR